MLSNNTFLETRVQRLLDGLIFVDRGLSVHVQRMLKKSRGLDTGGNFKHNAWKKSEEKLGTLFAIMIWHIYESVQTYYKNISCDHCMHEYHLYIWKMLTNREMVNFQKWNFFEFSLYSYSKLCHYRSTKNAYSVYVLLYL